LYSFRNILTSGQAIAAPLAQLEHDGNDTMPSTKGFNLKSPFTGSSELGLLSRLADIVILAITAHVSSLLCFSAELDTMAPIYRVLLYFCCGAAFFIFPHTGLYGSWRGRFMPSMLWRLATAWALVLLIGLVFSFAINLVGALSRLWLFYWFVTGTFYLAMYRIAVYFAMGYFRAKGYNHKRVVIIGYGKTGQEMHNRALQLNGYGYDIVAIHASKNEASDPSIAAVVRIETIEKIPQFIVDHNIQEVWITLPLSASPRLLDLQYLLRNALVDIAGCRTCWACQ
jgi:putative colanic acid biosynthesis UDP-glucose lipid carrier transferase